MVERYKDIIKQYTPEAKRKKVTITAKLEEVFVNTNEPAVRQLFSILIDNAIKYNQKGGTITVQTQRKRRHTLIKISDTGVGISAEDIPHIFDRFYRSDPSRNKADAEGFGLGLSLAKTIVNQLNGQIWVTSKIGKGTSFHIHLPF